MRFAALSRCNEPDDLEQSAMFPSQSALDSSSLSLVPGEQGIDRILQAISVGCHAPADSTGSRQKIRHASLAVASSSPFCSTRFVRHAQLQIVARQAGNEVFASIIPAPCSAFVGFFFVRGKDSVFLPPRLSQEFFSYLSPLLCFACIWYGILCRIVRLILSATTFSILVPENFLAADESKRPR